MLVPKNAKNVRHPTQNPNASQWNIGCVGFQTPVEYGLNSIIQPSLKPILHYAFFCIDFLSQHKYNTNAKQIVLPVYTYNFYFILLNLESYLQSMKIFFSKCDHYIGKKELEVLPTQIPLRFLANAKQKTHSVIRA